MSQQIPEWMMQLAEIGKQELEKKRLAEQNQLPHSEVNPDPLWKEKQVQRQELTHHIKKASFNASISAIQANAFRVLSSTMRGMNYKVEGTDLGQEAFLVRAFLYTPDKRHHIPATFAFTWNSQKEVALNPIFSSNERVYPLNASGFQMAFRESKENPHTTKMVSRAQIADKLQDYNPETLDASIRDMVTEGNLVPLTGNQFAYNSIPTKLANLPLPGQVAAPLNNDQKKELEEAEKLKDPKLQKPQEVKKPAGQNAPQPPKSPSETDEQYKQRTMTASRRYAVGPESTMCSCGKQLVNGKCPVPGCTKLPAPPAPEDHLGLSTSQSHLTRILAGMMDENCDRNMMTPGNPGDTRQMQNEMMQTNQQHYDDWGDKSIFDDVPLNSGVNKFCPECGTSCTPTGDCCNESCMACCAAPQDPGYQHPDPSHGMDYDSRGDEMDMYDQSQEWGTVGSMVRSILNGKSK